MSSSQISQIKFQWSLWQTAVAYPVAVCPFVTQCHELTLNFDELWSPLSIGVFTCFCGLLLSPVWVFWLYGLGCCQSVHHFFTASGAANIPSSYPTIGLRIPVLSCMPTYGGKCLSLKLGSTANKQVVWRFGGNYSLIVSYDYSRILLLPILVQMSWLPESDEDD